MPSGFVLTACITVRRAEKRAKWSWPSAMSNREHARAVLHLSSGEQLVAGVGGAVVHFAQRAGLREADLGPLACTLEEFCRRTLSSLEGEEETLHVFIEDFDDRIEIIVEHRGQGPDPPAGRPHAGTALHQADGRTARVEMISAVDRSEVEYDSRRQILRTRMVKFIRS